MYDSLYYNNRLMYVDHMYLFMSWRTRIGDTCPLSPDPSDITIAAPLTGGCETVVPSVVMSFHPMFFASAPNKGHNKKYKN